MLMAWRILLGVGMGAVIVAAFVFVPPVPGLGPTTAILFFHVPPAWVAVIAWLQSLVWSVLYLRRGDLRLDRRAAVHAELGMVFCAVTMVTGAIWARGTWGVYWNWDPRQTSVLMLLLIYIAYLGLRGTVADPVRRARSAAAYAIFAFATVPFLMFVVPRVFPSLHPSPLIGPRMGGGLEPAARMVFMAAVTGFTGLYAWIYRVRYRIQTLAEELPAKGEDTSACFSIERRGRDAI
jgi:heme exporter protein C